MDFTTEKIPTWALPYLINDDTCGLTEDEIAMIDKWCNDNNVMTVCPASEEEGECFPYFTHYPAFGLATDVIDCSVMLLK